MFRILNAGHFEERSVLSTLAIGLLLSGGLISAVEGATFSVNVTGAGCAPNAKVAAIVQGPQGPDPTFTQVGIADGSGNITFNSIDVTKNYQFVAVNPGCTPTSRDQVMDPNNFPAFVVDGGTKTIALTSGASDVTVTMNVKLPPGGPRLVMGNCSIASNNVQAGYGIAIFAGPGPFPIVFYNLRPAAANTYQCGVYDPADNRGGGAPIASVLTAGVPFTILGTVDLTQSFAPPPSTQGQSSLDGTQSGAPSLTVFVSSITTSTSPVSGAQLRLKNSQTGNPIFFTMTDPNGVGNFYGLQNGPTYYFLDVIAAGWQGKMNILFSTPTWSVTYSTNVQLSPLTNGGTLSGTVYMSGAILPNVWVNCHPDFNSYLGIDLMGGSVPHPGAGDLGMNAGGNGTFSFANMVPGNYDCFVNSPFSSGGNRIGDGADNQHGTADDLRLTISTTAVFQVYNAITGVQVSSAVPITVNIPISTVTANGTISGTLTFPDVANLTANPIILMAYETQVGFSTTPPHGGIAIVNGTGQSQTYTMNVPAGYKYNLQVRGVTYGPVNLNGGGLTADLSGTATAVTGMNFTMDKAGSVQVTLIGPNGSRWLPSTGSGFNQNAFCSAWVDADGVTVRSWNGTQVDNTGVVTISGLPAGTYNLKFMPQGNGCTVAPATLANINIGAGSTTNATLNIQNGVSVDVAGGTMPPGTVIPALSNSNNQFDGQLIGRVVAFPRGTPITLDLMRQLNGQSGDTLPVNLYLAKATNQNNQQVNAWVSRDGSFSPIQAPKIVPGDLTFYLFAEHSPAWEDQSATLSNYYDVLLGKSNAAISAANQTALSTVFGSSVVPVAIGSSFGGATISGNVTGTHIITKDDFIAAGGNGEKTFSYIPVCAVYDANASLLGLSYAIPAFTFAQRQTIDAAQRTGDVTTFLNLINSMKMSYSIPFIPAGTYSLVCATPNYPPVVHSITLAAADSKTLDIDFDKMAETAGTISGTVTDVNGTALPGATVSIRTKTTSKNQTTDANGGYSFPNLADGIYRMECTNPGYASATDKVLNSNGASSTVNFKLVVAPGSITGKVYASVFPNKVLASGAKVFAYDDTVNAARLDPDAPHWITQTDANGVYTLPNPTPGDVIKIFAMTDGKFPVGVSTTATAGAINAPDIILTALPPTLTVQVHPHSPTTVDLLLLSPKLLASNPTMKCSAGGTYIDATATDFSASVLAEPNNRYEAINILLPSAASTCRVIADDGIKQQSIDTVIDLTNIKEQSNNTVRDEAFGGGVESNAEDTGGDIDFPMGSIVTSSGTLPTTTMVRTSTTTLTDTTQLALSDVFQLQTDANLQLANGKCLDITLPVNKDRIPNPRSLRLAQIINGLIVAVNGEGYYDPLTGKFTVCIKSLSNAPAASSLRYASASPMMRGMAPFVNGSYQFNALSAGAQGGSFVLTGSLASASGSPYSGTSMNAFNFPNPFDLSNKSITASNGGTVTSTDGTDVATAIHYDLPAANGGHVVIRIYTVSGELVRVLDQGIQTGGVTNYATWDGKNMNGAHVATGVYFAVFDVPGLTPKEHVVKMAVLK